MNYKKRAERFKEARTDRNINGPESMRIVDEKTGVPKSTIQKLEKENDETKVGYVDIVTLANHYGVNVAWLMGQPGASPSIDENIQNAAKATGLSTKAIESLRRITDERSKLALSHFLETESITGIADWLSLAEEMIQNASINKVENWDERREITSKYCHDLTVEMKLDHKESARYFLSRAIQQTGDTLTYVIAEQWIKKVSEWVEIKSKEMKKNGKHSEKN